MIIEYMWQMEQGGVCWIYNIGYSSEDEVDGVLGGPGGIMSDWVVLLQDLSPTIGSRDKG